MLEIAFQNAEEITMQSIKAVLVAVSVLFVCNVLLFAQTPTKPTAQSAPGTDAQSNNVRDQDIEMLRADLRSQRKQITARSRGPLLEGQRQSSMQSLDE